VQTPESVVNKVNDEKHDGFVKTLGVFEFLAKLNKQSADPGQTNKRAAQDANEIVNTFFPGWDMKTKREYAGKLNNGIGSIITKLIG
jgi:hypothetical protein